MSARVLQDHTTLESVGGIVRSHGCAIDRQQLEAALCCLPAEIRCSSLVSMWRSWEKLVDWRFSAPCCDAPRLLWLAVSQHLPYIPGQFSVFVWHSNLRQLRTRTPRLACGSNGRAATPLTSLLFLDPRVLLTPILVVGFGLDGCPQRFRYFTGDVVLNHQDIVEGPVVDFRPDNVPVVRANQPRVHAQPAA